MPDSAKPKPTISSLKPPSTDESAKQAATNQHSLWLLGSLVAAIVLVGGWLGYQLATRYILEANKIKAQDILINALVQKQQALDQLRPNYDAITAKQGNGVSDADLILRALPLDADYKNLIAILEKIGQESGVQVTSVTQTGGGNLADSQTTASPGSTPQPFSFTVGLQGSYPAILQFLQKTEQSSRVMNFSSMTLSGGSGGNVQANITMSTDFQGPADISSTKRPL